MRGTLYKFSKQGVLVSFDDGKTFERAGAASLERLAIKQHAVMTNRRDPIKPDWIINE